MVGDFFCFTTLLSEQLIDCIFTAYLLLMKDSLKNTSAFDTKQSIKKASSRRYAKKSWAIEADGKQFTWKDKMDRVNLIRKGVPYSSIEVVSKKLNLPVKDVLSIINLPQTTYNKKKNEHSLLNSATSEIILMIIELTDYGLDVFNNEEAKFQRWMKKTNLALGGNSPESMMDTLTGISEVKHCLNRIEYGNFA